MADSKNERSKEGFLGRWSQRKQDIRAGKPLAEPEVTIRPVALTDKTSEPTLVQTSETTVITEKPEVPLPTMADVHELTSESDFSPFVAKNVPSEVRNSAMKKLFTDPHYNVMDRLDIYIDDYSQPDPIPESMLRQMVSAKFLNLFKAEEEEEEAQSAKKAALEAKTGKTYPLVGDDANTVSMQSVAKLSTENLSTQTIPLSGPHDDHTDLRLQQNHAAGPHKLGRGAE
jgi:Protein of unknown function (DUF3306)